MSSLIRQTWTTKLSLEYCLQERMIDLVKHLCSGQPALVPYDADANYEPCLKKGKRAHWATLVGCLVVTDQQLTEDESFLNCVQIKQLKDGKKLVHFEPKGTADSCMVQHFQFLIRHSSQLYVLARQGKSTRLQVWPFDRLCESNRQLDRVDDKILNHPERCSMIYPRNGEISKTLANQFILLYK